MRGTAMIPILFQLTVGEMDDNLSTETQDSHVELRKNLVRRYLFRLQRENEMRPTDSEWSFVLDVVIQGKSISC